MTTSSRRTLLQALAVSLLLHAVLLSGSPRFSPSPLAVVPTALNAVLRAPAPGAMSPAPARAVAKASAPQAPSAPRQLVVASPTMTAEAPPSVAANQDKAPAGGAGAASDLPMAPAAPSVSSGMAGAAPAPGRQGVSGVSGDDLRQYRLSLASAARRFKRYPALASQRGWEGTVEVALNVSASAPMPEVVLLRSSGRAVLDEQALSMLSQAARVTTLPEGLKARDFRIVLPVLFSLENDQ
jgi:periplasmic protein TonB